MYDTYLHRCLLGLLLLALPCLLSAQLAYALEVPGISGELSAVAYDDQIKICSFSYGFATDDAGRGGAQELTQGAFLLGKSVDRATPALFVAAARGKFFDEIILTAYREGGGNQVAIVYKFTTAVIAKFETGAKDSKGIDEVIGLLAEEVEITYYYYGNDGGLDGTYVESFNFVTGL
ncbi:MAG: type VI secretion system tube protein Hcp [Lewinella sp.]